MIEYMYVHWGCGYTGTGDPLPGSSCQPAPGLGDWLPNASKLPLSLGKDLDMVRRNIM